MTADSPSLPESHKRDAEAEFVAPVRHRARIYSPPASSRTRTTLRNDADRCFHCKDELFTAHGRDSPAVARLAEATSSTAST
jgi:uncharacterized protein